MRAVEPFTEAELLAIIVAIQMAREFTTRVGRLQPPTMFDTIEAKIRPALQYEDDVLDQLLSDALGELRWVH